MRTEDLRQTGQVLEDETGVKPGEEDVARPAPRLVGVRSSSEGGAVAGQVVVGRRQEAP
jgi:hypothetical protein